MSTMLICYSKTGFTARYAQWLAEATGVTLTQWEKGIDLCGCDTVIFASWLHAGRIQKLAWLKTHAPAQARKVVLVTSASPPSAASVSTVLAQNFQENRSDYQVFQLPGGLNYEKMGLVDRCLMRLFARMMRGKKNKTAEGQAMAEAISHSFDHTDKKYLEPVLTYLAQTE